MKSTILNGITQTLQSKFEQLCKYWKGKLTVIYIFVHMRIEWRKFLQDTNNFPEPEGQEWTHLLVLLTLLHVTAESDAFPQQVSLYLMKTFIRKYTHAQIGVFINYKFST